MERINDILSSFLYIETFVILIIAWGSWKRRKALGALPLFVVCLCSAFYAFGYGMEITASSLKDVNFWSKIEYLGLSFIPSLWIVQAYSLSANGKKANKLHISFLFIVPILTCIFRLTNEYFHFMYKNERLISNGYFYILSYQKGFWYYLYYIFFFICMIVSTAMYYKAFLKSTGLVRHQLKIMICVSISVLIFETFDQIQIVPLKMDYGAFIMFLVYVLFAYVVYPFDMLHIIPISREMVFDWIHDGVIVVDTDFNLKDFNYSAKEIFKSLDKSMIGTKIELCTSEAPEFEKMLKIWNDVDKVYSERSFKEDAFEFRIASMGSISYFKARLKALYYKGYRIGSTVLISNVTKEKEIIHELEKMARFDQLTGILNRRYFIELISIELSKLKKKDYKGILFMFDIDHFKRINDTYGHQAGDYILKEMVSIAKNMLRNKDLIGRYGGEEFIGFLPNISISEAMSIIECIRSAFEKYDFIYDGIFIKVTASFGVAEYYRQGSGEYFSYKEMVKRADTALYMAKENGRNQIAVN